MSRRARTILLSLLSACAITVGAVGAVAALTPGIAVASSSSSITVLPGQTAKLRVDAVGKGSYSGTVTLSLSGTKPAGTGWSLKSSSIRTGSYTTLTVATSSSTPPGTFTVRVKGVSGSYASSAYVKVVVTGTGKPLALTLASPVTVPGPGASTPVDLYVRNPNALAVRVQSLTLRVAGVVPGATPGGCSAADFETSAYSGPAWSIAAGATVRLSAAAPTSSTWPRLTMVNAAWNQDGCRGATVSLTLVGTGTG